MVNIENIQLAGFVGAAQLLGCLEVRPEFRSSAPRYKPGTEAKAAIPHSLAESATASVSMRDPDSKHNIDSNRECHPALTSLLHMNTRVDVHG